MDYIIIDIQGFYDNKNKFILKEIATLKSSGEVHHFIIKAPYSFNLLTAKTKYTNNWLTKNFHGFYWSDGKTKFCSVINFLKNHLNKQTKIYVKGEEKQKWVKNILNE